MKYDRTPVSPDEAVAFVPGVSFTSKHELDQVEGEGVMRSLVNLVSLLDSGDLSASDLLVHGVLAQLHRDAFESIWTWAGRFRTLEATIGEPPYRIRTAVHETEDDIAFLAATLTPEELAMTAHWRMVRVHPFVDGNGRITRTFADALLFGLTGTVFDWVEGERYYTALRDADARLGVDALLDLIGTVEP